MRHSLSANFINDDIGSLLRDESIKRIKIFALGPDGTNIYQASKAWIKNMNIEEKSDIILCSTPEEEVMKSMEIKEDSVIPIFALCTVYYNLCNLFFKYCNNYFFLSHFYMQLDSMQLASKKKTLEELGEHAIVARHLSPRMILEDTSYEFIDANSNAHAAQLCAEGKVEACITTETAKNIYNLNTIQMFGSPVMLFTFGTTEHGVSLLMQIKEGENDDSISKG